MNFRFCRRPKSVAKLRTTSPRRSGESGFAFLLALMAIVVLVALTMTLLGNRRNPESPRAGRGNDLARQSICPRDPPVLSQDWPLPAEPRRFDQGLARTAFPAPGLQKSDGSGRRRLAIHLCQSSRPDHRQHQVRKSPTNGIAGFEWRGDAWHAADSGPARNARVGRCRIRAAIPIRRKIPRDPAAGRELRLEPELAMARAIPMLRILQMASPRSPEPHSLQPARKILRPVWAAPHRAPAGF